MPVDVIEEPCTVYTDYFKITRRSLFEMWEFVWEAGKTIYRWSWVRFQVKKKILPESTL